MIPAQTARERLKASQMVVLIQARSERDADWIKTQKSFLDHENTSFIEAGMERIAEMSFDDACAIEALRCEYYDEHEAAASE